MNLYKQYLKQGLIALVLFSIYACEKDPEQHLELGNWYLQKGLIDDAITEYREVSRLLPPDHSKLDREEFIYSRTIGTQYDVQIDIDFCLRLNSRYHSIYTRLVPILSLVTQ